MSIKMNLLINGKPFPLWDMPTHVTCMCMTGDDGVIHYDLSGNKARAAIRRYIEWVKGHLDDVFADEEEYEKLRKVVDNHVTELENKLEKARHVVVSAY